MPAPKALSMLPKPILFGLYGAIGGLLGALVFGEILWWVLKPPAAVASLPEPRVAIAASKDVEVFVEGRNSFPVQIARADFEGPVTVRFDDLPTGVTASPVNIPADKTEGEVVVMGGRAAPVTTKTAKLVAEATANGKTASADAAVSVKVWDPPRPQADIVFVLDVTSSMQWAIDDLKNGIGKFADTLAKARIDYRLGLVAFRDVTVKGEKVEVVEFNTGDVFTADGTVFREKVGTFRASGGGDIPESSLEAITAASNMPFRKSATKVLLLITDAPPKVLDQGGRHSDAAIPAAVLRTTDAVKAATIDSVHLVISKLDLGDYKPFMLAGIDKSGGKHFELGDIVRGDEGFDPVLATFSTAVTEAARAKIPDSKPLVAERGAAPVLGVKSLQSGEQSAAGTEGKVVLRSGVWAGAIAALVCLALLAGQHHYLRGTLPSFGGIIVGLLGGLIVGFVGGAAGQGLFFLAPANATLATAFRVLGWVLLGGLAGAGLSPFIPNLKWPLGLLGGAIGGAVGAAAFLFASDVGERLGRIVGGLMVGFCIGLMVAIVEAAFRRAWLEVRYGARETITVTLGPEPVKIGGDAKMCTVWARGAAPLALRFFVRDGNVICDDAVMKRESPAADGFSKEVGNVTVTVRTGSGTTNAPVQAPTAPKPALAKAAPARVAADDDYDGLPMPISPPQARPTPTPIAEAPSAPATKPAAPPPKPVAPPAPTATKPPAPAAPPKPAAPVAAPKPTAPAGPKNPDACPGCGRVNAGKPKQRYCMVCDNTY
ncbi:MAG: VWA domain-containing protein [Planctomycetes bacterium]|nr:VWA domain-containing protein [Planctomycetota bacterium]